jgi:hypothetical protein
MRVVRTAVLLLLVLAVAASAEAQTTIAIRGGVSANPNQGLVGASLDMAGLAPHPDVSFRPSVEIGFGSGQTTVSGNLDLVFRVRLADRWSGYFGGGPSVLLDHTSGVGNTFAGDFHGLAGIQNDRGLFIEVKHGQAVGFQAMVGWVLRHKP